MTHSKYESELIQNSFQEVVPMTFGSMQVYVIPKIYNPSNQPLFTMLHILLRDPGDCKLYNHIVLTY